MCSFWAVREIVRASRLVATSTEGPNGGCMLATDTRELRHNGNSAGRTDAAVPDHRENEHADADTDTDAGSDEVLKALGELDAVLRENAERERELFPGERAGMEVHPGRRGRAQHRAARQHHSAPSVGGQRVPPPVLGGRPPGRGPEHPEHRPPLRRDPPAGVQPVATGGPGRRLTCRLSRSFPGRAAVREPEAGSLGPGLRPGFRPEAPVGPSPAARRPLPA
jgi:hypothetical protein